jgi:hypothetical protein
LALIDFGAQPGTVDGRQQIGRFDEGSFDGQHRPQSKGLNDGISVWAPRKISRYGLMTGVRRRGAGRLFNPGALIEAV